MAGFPRHAWIGGRLVRFADARISIADRGVLFGESAYEVLPITAGRVRLRDVHLDRLERTATAIGLSCGDVVVDGCPWMDALIAAENIDEGLLYVQLTGGEAPRAHTTRATPQLFAYASPHVFPDHAQRRVGIAVACSAEIRWARCDLKTTMLLPSVLGKREAQTRGADEVLWIGDDGAVHEAGSANIAIVEDGVVIVPPPSRMILPGITVAFVQRIAGELGIAWHHESFDRARVLAADEAFVASTSQLVMPVVRVDDIAIGNGEGGPIALALGDALRDAIELA